MENRTPYSVAGYVRLSREDGDKTESDSVGNQKKLILDEIAGREDCTLFDMYVDDGCTGLHFERPSFRRLLADIEKGKVNCVIVKDDCVIIELNAESLIKCGFCAVSSIF